MIEIKVTGLINIVGGSKMKLKDWLEILCMWVLAVLLFICITILTWLFIGFAANVICSGFLVLDVKSCMGGI